MMCLMQRPTFIVVHQSNHLNMVTHVGKYATVGRLLGLLCIQAMSKRPVLHCFVLSADADTHAHEQWAASCVSCMCLSELGGQEHA